VEPIRVLIVDDHALFREGLRLLLEKEPDIRVVGEAADGAQAVEQTEAHKPDVVLLDVLMPEVSGLDVLPRIRDKSPDTKVLIVTGFLEPNFIAAALSGGVRGYVLKTVPPATLVKAIRAVQAGEIWAERRILTMFLDRLLEKVNDRRRLAPEAQEPLTAREREIAEWVIQGMRNREIAARLQISEKTVKTHLSNIFRKLNVNRRVELLLSRLGDGGG
jgi:DNA-binding NarL/FixJ family response regulator